MRDRARQDAGRCDVLSTAGRGGMGQVSSTRGLQRPAESGCGRDRVRRIVSDRLFSAEAQASVGRYRLVEQLGAGGMATVWAAVDEQLERPAAIKFLHQAVDLPRLVREARALAAISHPNIVAVYDVGTQADEPYIAMELVDGVTLSAWLRAGPTWREVVDAMLQAARGLRAAHDAGLVHRDFKPSNAMIRGDGRVQLLDFGLVAARYEVSQEGLAEGSRPGSTPLWEGTESLTHAGAIVGTPAYMPPEQLAGEPVGPAVDQFAFCVTFYEALYGTRPFANDLRSGQPPTLARRQRPARLSRRVPRWLHAAIVRGLSVDPSDRWASMDALISELERPRRSASILLPGLIAVAVTLGGLEASGRAEAPSCLDGAERVSAAWSRSARDRLEGAFAPAGEEGAHAWRRVEPRLWAYTIRWRAAWAQGCAGAVTRSAPASANATSRCLAQRLRGFEAVVEELAQGGTAVATHGDEAVLRLAPPLDCVELPARALAVSPELVEVASELRVALARAETMFVLGRNAAASTIVEAVAARAHELGLRHVGAEAGLLHGHILFASGDFDAADATLQRAYWLAVKTQHDHVALNLTVKLVHASLRTGRLSDAESWLRHAKTTLDRLPSDHATTASVLQQEATLAYTLGQRKRALELSKAALEHAELAFAEPHPDVAGHLSDLGVIMLGAGDLERGRDVLARANAIYTGLYGRRHRSLAMVQINLAAAETMLGHRDVARAWAQSAHDVSAERGLTPTATTAAALIILGGLDLETGHVDRAIERTREGIAQSRVVFGEGHPRTASALADLSEMFLRAERWAEAEESSLEAVSATETAYGRDHPATAAILVQRGRVLRLLQRTDEAAALLERALRSLEDAEPVPPSFIEALLELGSIGLAVGDRERAHQMFERATEIATGSGAQPGLHARARFGLAKAAKLEGDLELAARHAEAAVHWYSKGPPRPEIETVRRWMEELAN